MAKVKAEAVEVKPSAKKPVSNLNKDGLVKGAVVSDADFFKIRAKKESK